MYMRFLYCSDSDINYNLNYRCQSSDKRGAILTVEHERSIIDDLRAVNDRYHAKLATILKRIWKLSTVKRFI